MDQQLIEVFKKYPDAVGFNTSEFPLFGLLKSNQHRKYLTHNGWSYLCGGNTTHFYIKQGIAMRVFEAGKFCRFRFSELIGCNLCENEFTYEFMRIEEIDSYLERILETIEQYKRDHFIHNKNKDLSQQKIGGDGFPVLKKAKLCR